MSLLDQLMTLPDRESVVRAKKAVPVKITITATSNPLKPKVKLSSSALELIRSQNEYVLFRENKGELYIASPSPYSTTGEPNKKFDTRITATSTLEITKAVIDTWSTDLGKYLGEWTLEYIENTIDNKAEEAIDLKIFKLVLTNGNSNESNEQLQAETTIDGLSHDEGKVDGSEHGLSNSVDVDGGDQREDELLSENPIF